MALGGIFARKGGERTDRARTPGANDPAQRLALLDQLEESGLVYFDDYFELSGNWPTWLRLYVAAR